MQQWHKQCLLTGFGERGHWINDIWRVTQKNTHPRLSHTHVHSRWNTSWIHLINRPMVSRYFSIQEQMYLEYTPVCIFISASFLEIVWFFSLSLHTTLNNLFLLLLCIAFLWRANLTLASHYIPSHCFCLVSSLLVLHVGNSWLGPRGRLLGASEQVNNRKRSAVTNTTKIHPLWREQNARWHLDHMELY